MLLVNDLTIQHLSDRPHGIIAEGISFSLKRGDSLGIVGESGSGKTITALSLLRLLPYGLDITSGQILYTSKNGEEIDLSNIGINPSLKEEFSQINPGMSTHFLIDTKNYT